MFKVLREVPGKKPAVVPGGKHHLLWPRPAVKALLAKQLQTGLAGLEGQGRFENWEDYIQESKEKTPEQLW